ncbi:hypothetical protein QFC24_007098 [Naganishia onofrii]|uniref:Uncharacterized protein n=1 Tax=Naganishia onofrii TaxID=1851511 RepID=A0ACC2WSQ1_9TREE|nr:hypothetical protein QFC24_007098 [Naganishia onofrii]
MSSTTVLRHPLLGAIRGISPASHPHLTQFLGLPYATIPGPSRFGRSVLRTDLPVQSSQQTSTPADSATCDATTPGPTAVQPWGSAKMDAKGLQLPTDRIPEGEGDEQSERDCLHLSITLPTELLTNTDGALAKVPVILFQHGGAFFLGSGDRSYYSPFTFLSQALHQKPSQPLIFVSCNFRLGALGFLHSSKAGNGISLPPNNGLHDQLHVYEWLKRFISGFGGDPENITAIGQSAGAESLSLHNLLTLHAKKPRHLQPYRRSILFSGSPLCMPAKTPDEHEENFRSEASKLGIDASDTRSSDILKDLEKIDIEEIRKAAWVGIPCSQSEMMPYKTPSMALLRGEKDEDIVNDGVKRWVPEQLISACGFDGGISYNMLVDDDKRKDHAKVFSRIVRDVIQSKTGKGEAAQALLELYELADSDVDDPTALNRICQFESDIGFFAPALAECVGASASDTTRSYLQLFELGNPFPGPLEQEKYATHTWDIVALLGAFEDKLSPGYQRVIRAWRDRIITFIAHGADEAGMQEWKPAQTSTENAELALVVDAEGKGGMRFMAGEEYIGSNTRRGRLLSIAKQIHERDGADVLWNDVCRRFLMKGE